MMKPQRKDVNKDIYIYMCTTCRDLYVITAFMDFKKIHSYKFSKVEQVDCLKGRMGGSPQVIHSWSYYQEVSVSRRPEPIFA